MEKQDTPVNGVSVKRLAWYWSQVARRSADAVKKRFDTAQHAVEGCATVIAIGIVAFVGQRYFNFSPVQSLTSPLAIAVAQIIASIVLTLVALFVYGIIFQPAAWHYEIAPSGDDIVVRNYHAADNKKVGIWIDNPSDQKVTDVRVMLKSLTRIWIRSGSKIEEQINQDNLQFTRGAYFDEGQPIEIRRKWHVIIDIAEDRGGAPVFSLKREISPFRLEKLTDRFGTIGEVIISDEREVAVWEIELQIDGFTATGELPTKLFKSNIVFEKRTESDLYGKPEIDSGIYLGISIDAQEAEQKATAPSVIVT